MPRRRNDRFLNEALESFSHFLKTTDWRGKERECVNLFAHKFLFEKIEPGAAIECPTQVSIECALKQPAQFANRVASYTADQVRSFGYLVSVDYAADEPTVYWKQAQRGVFSKVRCV